MDYMNEKRECKFAGKCGACQTLNLTYDRELSLKMKKVITLLGKFGHVEEIIPMERPIHYRNKVQYLLDYNGGRVRFGLYRASDGGIVPVDHCFAEDPEASSVCRTAKKLIDKYRLSVYDGRRGLVRHVMARRAFSTGELLCSIVTTDAPFPRAEEFARELAERQKNVRSVSRIINTTSMPLMMNGEETVLYGDGVITDTLCGASFDISAKSFYQINPTQTEVLYGTACRYAALKPGDNVLDAYCGIGTVGIIAAKSAKNISLTGFDVNSDAIRDAAINAEKNGIAGAKFYCMDDRKFAISNERHMNVIFADPPRAGCEKRFLDFVLTHKPERFVYISCNPETLARDLAYLKRGFKIEKIQPVDMFPGTTHVETVVCLSREKADDYRKESKMISDEKSAYKSWSNLKKQMNDLLCDSLKGKISYFYTSYHEVHNAYGRATIQYEKKEIVAFSWDRQYEQVQDIKEQYRKMDNVPSMLVDYEGSLNAYKVANIAATKEKWMPNCTLCETDFINSLTIYLKTDIATSLNSDNYLLRVFAYMDRRVGKRTLIKIKDDVEKLPDWVKQFYRIRCEADGIIFPPKRITDETVALLSMKKADGHIRFSVQTKDLHTKTN